MQGAPGPATALTALCPCLETVASSPQASFSRWAQFCEC